MNFRDSFSERIAMRQLVNTVAKTGVDISIAKVKQDSMWHELILWHGNHEAKRADVFSFADVERTIRQWTQDTEAH